MIPATLVPALGWALLDFLWQGAAIGLAAALLLAALRNARPQARYAVACAALVLCALLPLGALLAGPVAPDALPDVAAASQDVLVAVGSDGPATLAADTGWRDMLQGRLAWIVALWSFGAGLFALRLLAGVAWVGDIRARAQPVDAHWQQRLDQLARAVGVRPAVQFATAPQVDGPVVAGWWRPVVLLPAALLTRLPPDLVEALLAHELAHIRRHDYLVNLVQGVIEALLFYHPVVWWLSRRIRIERELIADDLALRAIGEPQRLARALQQLDLFQAARASHVPASAFPRLLPAAHGGKLMSRIQRLVIRPRIGSADWRLLVPLAGLALVALSVYAKSPAAPAVPRVPAVAAVAAVAPVSAVAPVPAVAPVAAVSSVPGVAPVAAVAPVPAVAPVAAIGAVAAVAPRPRHHEPYALVRDGEDAMMLSGDLGDLADIKRTRQHLQGDFLWFRRNGDDYVVQDPTVLARARQAWGPAEALGREMEAIGAQMEPYSKQMEALGEKMEALSKRAEPYNGQMERLGKQMEPIAEKQRVIGDQMGLLGQQMAEARNDADRDRLAAKMDALQAQMAPLGAQMDQVSESMRKQGAEMERWHAPMADLGKQMEAASAPMKPLGDKMGVLGKRQEALTHKADAEVLVLIEQSLREGKAQPARQLR
jgi:beta-lactamase regulating signal transducer with metallopeptidase domain/predicted  nucleic acid-binding Zn-ribbon protein